MSEYGLYFRRISKATIDEANEIRREILELEDSQMKTDLLHTLYLKCGPSDLPEIQVEESNQ